MDTPVEGPTRRGTPYGRARVLVCRGCCCGTERKHPDVDHDGQLDALLGAAGPDASARVTACVGMCSASNLVIVGRPGGTRVWLGGILDEESTQALAAWIGQGCHDPVPGALRSHVVGRTLEVA